VVLTGLLYIIFGFVTGHFRKNLAPDKAERSWRAFSMALASHLRFERPSEAEAWSYNLLQRLAYLFVIFVLFPFVIWTGLAMSPALFPQFRRPSMCSAASSRRAHFTSSYLWRSCSFC